MTWKAYAAVSGAGLLATYLFSGPASVVSNRIATPRPNVVTPRAAPPAFDIQEQASRLQAHDPVVTEYHEPSRNPFRFADRAKRAPGSPRDVAPSPPPPPVTTPATPVVPPPPPIRLSGIATETVGDTRQRSAILITPEGVQRVREGDQVATIYRVTRIEEDAVELVANDGTTRRLPLRP